MGDAFLQYSGLVGFAYRAEKLVHHPADWSRAAFCRRTLVPHHPVQTYLNCNALSSIFCSAVPANCILLRKSGKVFTNSCLQLSRPLQPRFSGTSLHNHQLGLIIQQDREYPVGCGAATIYLQWRNVQFLLEKNGFTMETKEGTTIKPPGKGELPGSNNKFE